MGQQPRQILKGIELRELRKLTGVKTVAQFSRDHTATTIRKQSPVDKSFKFAVNSIT